MGADSPLLAAGLRAGACSASTAVRTTQTFFGPLFSSKLGIHGDWAGSLTAPWPNPDLVTIPLTAHPPAHPPLHSGPPRGAGSRLPSLSPAQNAAQTSRNHWTRKVREGANIY